LPFQESSTIPVYGGFSQPLVVSQIANPFVPFMHPGEAIPRAVPSTYAVEPVPQHSSPSNAATPSFV